MENQNLNPSGENVSSSQSSEIIPNKRPLVPVSFALAIICFFFVFCDFKCFGQNIGSVTGINLVTGVQFEGSELFDESESGKIPSNFWAILAFGAGIIGLGIFLIRSKNEAEIGAVAGAVGFGSLLILQIVIKNGTRIKGEGQLEADFQPAYWLALLAMGTAALVSYLIISKNTNAVSSAAPPLQDDPIPEKEGQAQPPEKMPLSAGSSGDVNITKWLEKNKKTAIGLIGLLSVILAVFQLFIKQYPGKDAERVLAFSCACAKKYDSEIIKASEKFIASFSPENFNTRQEARGKLEELKNPIYASHAECNQKAVSDYTQMRNRYLKNSDKLKKFDLVYSSNLQKCNRSDEHKMNSIAMEAENKINSIQDPEPDMEKIKSDIIGRQIPGWKFEYLSEFKDVEVIDVTRGNDRLEYKVKFQLLGHNSKSEHECEVMIVYLYNMFGWYFKDLKMNYITYINTFYPDRYLKIVPLKNCSWTAENKFRMSWKTSNFYSKEYFTSPDQDPVSMPYSDVYYVKSLEDKEIQVKFTYRVRK
jgi:hypothetical protein